MLTLTAVFPNLAADQAQVIEEDDLQYQLVSTVADLWAQEDPTAALTYARSIDDGRLRFAFERAALTKVAIASEADKGLRLLQRHMFSVIET